jgi:hypothetical protein
MGMKTFILTYESLVHAFKNINRYVYKMGLWEAIHKFIAELMGLEQFDEENPDPDTSTSRV